MAKKAKEESYNEVKVDYNKKDKNDESEKKSTDEYKPKVDVTYKSNKNKTKISSNKEIKKQFMISMKYGFRKKVTGENVANAYKKRIGRGVIVSVEPIEKD